MARTEVHKFGGTSVGSAERIAHAATLIRDAAQAGDSPRIVVVTSAMSGVTDALVRAAQLAESGDRDRAVAQVYQLLERHLSVLGAEDDDDASSVGFELRRICDELAELIRASVLIEQLTPRSRDRSLSSGEKLAARLLALELRRLGCRAVAVDADTFLETDDHFGEANPVAGVAERSVGAALEPILDAGGIAVVTGFCGRSPDGATTTLGRGGSDLTATFIAAALKADEVTIWTDVNGVYSADPRTVPGARILRHLHYREAAEMSYYGAKVLHQRSMIPVVGPGIPVRIRNSMDPDAGETRVDARHSPGSHPVKAISAVREQSLLSIEGKGMAGVPGVAARAFGALADERISVTMISQSSSESSICLAVPDGAAAGAETALKRAFRQDLSRGDVEEIAVLSGVGLIAAVGLGMAHTPGIAARVFGALAAGGVNVLAVAQGSSELNISLAVDGEDVDRAVAAIHDEFGLHRIDTGDDSADRFDLILLGLGKIGRDLVRLLDDRRPHIAERFGLRPRVVGIADRSGYLLRPAGIPADELAAAMAHKAEGRALAGLPGGSAASRPQAVVGAAVEYRLSRPVLVDVSDADDAEAAFVAALRSGCDVVTANKKPLAGDEAAYRSLIEESRRSGRVLKAEATVGAGLPVVDTLEMLLATGDRLVRAEGCLSGTLAFLFMRLAEGARMSEAVAEAAELGYTEPDPVTDLSGVDVARKAIILGRLSGLVGDASGVRPEGLVDAGLAGRPLDALVEKLRRDHDAPWAERVARAADAGKVWRYVARVEQEHVEVGAREMPLDSPLGMLQGTDNMIVFESERYRERPLVVTGPGAGVEVTAMGVLGDILRVVAERRGR